jgi:hypothetical protein
MKKLRNEKGVALLMALILTLVSLGMIMAVLYLITQGMQVSASSRRYKSALEASYGGVEVFTKEIIPQLMGAGTPSGLENVLAGIAPTQYPSYAAHQTYSSCMKTKLANPASNWGNMCGASPSSSTNLPASYDMWFTLKGPPLQPNFNVYVKIVDTQPGNSDLTGQTQLDSGSGVAYGASGISPMHIPATYHIETQAQSASNPREKARLSVLYAY